MARLPTVGADSGNWGTILNEFLNQEHNPDGTHGIITPTDIKTQGPWVDVRNYASINAAVTAIGSDNKTLLIPNAQTLTASLTIPSNIHLVILKGGSIAKASTCTLTINGPFEAGLYQVFSGFSAGNVIFGTGSIKEVYPQWGGASGDWNGSKGTDNLAAFDCAVDSLPTGGGIVRITSPGDYYLSDPWKVDKSNTTIIVDAGATVRTINAHGEATILLGNLVSGKAKSNIHLKGGGTVTCSGSGTTEHPIGISEVDNWSVVGMRVVGGRKAGITAQCGISNGLISQNYIEDTNQFGILIGATNVKHPNALTGIEISHNIIKNIGLTGGNARAGIRCDDFDGLVISDNLIDGVISSSTGYGIETQLTSLAENYNLVLSNNIVRNTDASGYYILFTDGVVSSSNISYNAGLDGVVVYLCKNVQGDFAIYDAGRYGYVDMQNAEAVNVKVIVVDNAAQPAVYLHTVPEINKYELTVKGTTHNYAFSIVGTTNKAHITGHVDSGTSALYTGDTPPCFDDLHADGKPYMPVLQFTANDTTPSVKNHNLWKTANTSSTTITMFDDGYEGQNIKVLIQDANTIIGFTGTNLKGNSGADWHPSNGDWMECVFDGTSWFCSVHDCTS